MEPENYSWLPHSYQDYAINPNIIYMAKLVTIPRAIRNSMPSMQNLHMSGQESFTQTL